MPRLKSGGVPTLADVARASGVGIATVSRVVNGGVNVSPETLKKVQRAVRRLGYLPNHAARILKGGRTKTIGLLIPSIADSFFSSCAGTAGEVAQAHDSLLLFAESNNDPALELSNLAVLMQHRPDGLLLVPSSASNRALRLFVQQSPVPIVTLDRPFPGCAAVLTNSFEAAREATLHLVGHGRKRILCLAAEPSLYTIRERLRGYSDAMLAAGLPSLIDTSLAIGAHNAETLIQGHLGSRTPPDAIFTLKNSATTAAYQALQRLKLNIPREIALIGFDDFELAGMLRPALTVVQQPIEDVGRRAAELLFAQLGSDDGSTPPASLRRTRLVLPNRLLLRSSCGCRHSARGPEE
ncbi:LacI family DNA-binding transcriptional regulator [Acidipila sp. EB88]|uniref:LacI family DNA-binding transcriptional regulator n=1 Tax=Acidipila sp. EB88 TaxID=2305226 RepID=UPI0013153AC3|nr:LacI family DNA-binding transcriptional regulator [Acidipila sp. EB88]